MHVFLLISTVILYSIYRKDDAVNQRYTNKKSWVVELQMITNSRSVLFENQAIQQIVISYKDS